MIMRISGEPVRAYRLHTREGKYGYHPKEKIRVIHGLYLHHGEREEKGGIVWYPAPRETEGREKVGGSLSIFIVPVEIWEISPMKARE